MRHDPRDDGAPLFNMVSGGVRQMGARWEIYHPFDHAACFADKYLSEALQLASDHYPVVLDLDL